MRNEITALRAEMEKRGIYAYIVMTEDFHGSEYVGAHFKLREYLSGFTGSAGTLVVTPEEAALWTDGRYFIQAEAQLGGSGIKLMKQGEPDTPTIEAYIAERVPDGMSIGFDGRAVNAAFVKRLKKALKNDAALLHEFDLAGEVWKERPPLSREPVYELPLKYCGASRAEKLANIRAVMARKGADCLALSALDEIAWTLDLRGGDVEYNPVFLAFMLVFADKAQLFVNRDIISDEIAGRLDADGVELCPYHGIYDALRGLSCAVWTDARAVNHSFFSALSGARLIDKASPVQLMKACKNDAEINSLKNAHLKDGIAVTRFMRWIKSAVKTARVTELSAAEKLESFRRQGADYLGQSFEPIIAYGEHAAVVHYSATDATNAVIEPRGFVLCDTGGHYLDGTTDVTRTIALGETGGAQDAEARRLSAYVLAAHLELLHTVFPAGVRGAALDCIARRELWRHGLDYNHGTGHGVGFLLNVHEGPQRISYKALGDAPLKPGMVTSDEPGLYFEGRFGIRHESLMLCVKREDTGSGFLGFEPLTLAPFDLDSIDLSALSEQQREWFREYQDFVYRQLTPFLDEDERIWLGNMIPG